VRSQRQDGAWLRETWIGRQSGTPVAIRRGSATVNGRGRSRAVSNGSSRWSGEAVTNVAQIVTEDGRGAFRVSFPIDDDDAAAVRRRFFVRMTTSESTLAGGPPGAGNWPPRAVSVRATQPGAARCSAWLGRST